MVNKRNLDKHQLAHARLLGAVSSPIRPGIVAISLEDGENILKYIKRLEHLLAIKLKKLAVEVAKPGSMLKPDDGPNTTH